MMDNSKIKQLVAGSLNMFDHESCPMQRHTKCMQIHPITYNWNTNTMTFSLTFLTRHNLKINND